MVIYGIVRIVGNEALMVTVLDAAATIVHYASFSQGSLHLILLSYQ
jgi:hypothetical protein